MNTSTQETEEKVFADGDMLEAYSTRDLEFAVSCMARKDLNITLLQCTMTDKSALKLEQVSIHLSAKDPQGNEIQNPNYYFDRLRSEYNNGQFAVDPQHMFAIWRSVRSTVIEVIDRNRIARGRVSLQEERKQRFEQQKQKD